MFYTVMRIIAVLLVLCISRSSVLGQDTSRIINGDDAPSNRYPYTVSLQYASSDFHFCGGSLIAPSIILSAAHCEPPPGSTIKAVINPFDLQAPNSNSIVSGVTQIRIHPFFTSDLENDVMLIILSSSVPSSIAVPIRLNEDSNEPQVGDSLTVMGWGTTILGESAEPDVLQEVDVSYLSNNACRFSYPNQGVTNDMMCCLEAGQGSCQGDSGGPLIIPGANSAGDVQAGIVSWGILCALDAYPGVYNRVSDSFGWIKENVCEITNQAPDYFNCGGSAPPPSSAPLIPNPTPAPGPTTNVLVQIRMDDFPQEVGWKIVDSSIDLNVPLIQFTPGTYFVQGATVQQVVSVRSGGTYSLVLFDQAGDGLCCEYGFGEVHVFLGSSADPTKVLVSSDGRYLESKSLPFTASTADIGNNPADSVGLFTVRFKTDLYPQESYWDIRTLDGTALWFAYLEGWAPGSEVTYVLQLTLGEEYNFYVFDEAGDGICCEYGFGDASIYFGTQVDSSLELANVDGIFFSFTSETFIAEDPSVAVSGAGSASFTVRFVNDNYPMENQWNIQTLNGDVIWYAFMDQWGPGTDIIYPVDLVIGESYRFVVYDSRGDGLCCDYGSGFAEIYYGSTLTIANRLAFIDGTFTFNKVVEFVAQESSGGGGGGGGFGCFPSHASCEVKGRGAVLMEDLKIGDHVLVGGGSSYEPIYSFGHRLRDASHEYLRIKASSTEVEVSAEHLLFVKDRGPIPASQVEVGDSLLNESEEELKVHSVTTIMAHGVFAPFTPSGRIIVGGVLASSFVSLDNSPTLQILGVEFTYHWLSHIFESPHRLVCHHLGQCLNEAYDSNGLSLWASAPFHLTKTLLSQPLHVQYLVLIPTLLVLAILNIAGLFLYRFAVLVLAACLACMMMHRRKRTMKH